MTKRTIAIAGALLLAALPLFAQAQGQGQAQGRGGRGGPGGPGWMPMLHQLNLTDAQKDQVKALADAERQAGPPKTFELEQKLHAAVLADQPNLQTIESLKASITAAQAEDLDRRIDHLQKLAQILTPDQKQQLVAMEAQHGPGRRGRQ
jgi:Spy/CpxP family protein refolding chaperone